jgi:hypothetical protein
MTAPRVLSDWAPPSYIQDGRDNYVGRFWLHDDFGNPERIVEMPSTEPGVQLIRWISISQSVHHGRAVHQGYLIIHRTCAGGRLSYDRDDEIRVSPKPLVTLARVVVMPGAGHEVMAIRASEAVHAGRPMTHEEAIAGNCDITEDTTEFADLALSDYRLGEVDDDGLRIDPWRGPLACAVGWTANYV